MTVKKPIDPKKARANALRKLSKKRGNPTGIHSIDRKGAVNGKIDGPTEERFLKKIYEGFTTGVACEAIGVSRQAIYAHNRKHPDTFGKAWVEAKETGRDERADKVRDTMWERAVEGYQETEVRQWKGAKGETRTATKMVKKVDNTLLLALAKSLMPDEFRDRVSVDKKLDVSEALADLMDKAANAPKNHLTSLVGVKG